MVMRVNDELLASLYDGRCVIYESRPEIGTNGWLSESGQQEKYSDIPCHLAFEQTGAANGNVVSEVKAVCTLFLGVQYEISPGSRIKVWQNGREYDLALTGLPRVYVVHQEVKAALLDNLA